MFILVPHLSILGADAHLIWVQISPWNVFIILIYPSEDEKTIWGLYIIQTLSNLIVPHQPAPASSLPPCPSCHFSVQNSIESVHKLKNRTKTETKYQTNKTKTFATHKGDGELNRFRVLRILTLSPYNNTLLLTAFYVNSGAFKSSWP